MLNVVALLPHSKKDNKVESAASKGATLNELVELKSCSSCLFFEVTSFIPLLCFFHLYLVWFSLSGVRCVVLALFMACRACNLSGFQLRINKDEFPKPFFFFFFEISVQET